MTRKIKVGNVYIGGGAPISVQSMCNTKTADVENTIKQIISLQNAGCDIVRFAVNSATDAAAIKEIKNATDIPLVADIQYDYKLAVLSAENGIDKVRINPGNIGDEKKVRYFADVLKERNIPIRIGVNTGSLEKDLKDLNPADALVESARRHIKILENAGFFDIIVSLKSSDVRTSVAAARKFSKEFDYPLHLGVTEAGTFERGIIKNTAGLSPLLLDGIGDTIRISLTTDPVEEVIAGRMLLKSLGLNDDSEVIACPTCARTEIPLFDLATKVEKMLAGTKGLKVAVMGCVVNGVGEGEKADFGIAGGKEKSVIFEKGKITKTIDNSLIFDEINALIAKYKAQNEKV